MSNSNFLKVQDCVYNHNYIKSIKCDDEKCTVTIANTKQSSSGSGLGSSNYDHDHHCWKGKDSECYNSLSAFVRNIRS